MYFYCCRHRRSPTQPTSPASSASRAPLVRQHCQFLSCVVKSDAQASLSHQARGEGAELKAHALCLPRDLGGEEVVPGQTGPAIAGSDTLPSKAAVGAPGPNQCQSSTRVPQQDANPYFILQCRIGCPF